MKEKAAGVTRRGLLQHAGMVVAAAAIPGAVTANAQQEPATHDRAQTAPVPEIMTKLSAYMSEAGDRALPENVLEKTKEHTLDTIASMISGVDLPPAQVALRFAREQADQQHVAAIVGTSLLCGPIEAALANGMMAHSDETDDSHAPSHSHPGCAIVAAALAAGERFGVSGTRFLRSITLGYDIGPRVLMTLGGLPFQMTTHRSAHCIANTFGAAAAAGCAARFTAQQMRWLLDYAAQQASGIAAWQRDTQHIEKSFVFGGSPARNGVTAALLIHLGATGVDDIFSGADNFLIAFAPDADPEKLIDKLGDRYEVTRTNIKKWTVGSPIQAPLDALQDLMKQHPITPAEVESVIVRVATSEAKTVNNRNMPDISLQHMVAVMILDQTVTFRSAHDKSRMQDPAVLAMKQKVKLVPDEGLEKLYPKRVTIVDVNLKDGRHLTDRVEAVRGTAENPMSREEVTTKARDLMEPHLGTEPSRKLIDAIFNIEAVSDIRSIRALLQGKR